MGSPDSLGYKKVRKIDSLELIVFATIPSAQKSAVNLTLITTRLSYRTEIMDDAIESKLASLQSKQTEQLYKALRYSAIGTMVVAVMMVLFIGPKSDQQAAWGWFFVILIISLYRWGSALIYARLDSNDKTLFIWRLRFHIGAYLAALAWSSSMWLFYPVDYPEYQVVMVLGLAGIASGATAIQAYDKLVITLFQSILFVGIESRLLWEGGTLSSQLAVFLFIYFAFLIKGGRDIGTSYHELLTLRHDTEEHNLTLLSTTERIARIGYWQWDMVSDKVELSANLAAMCGVEEKMVEMGFCQEKVHVDDRHRVQMAIDKTCNTGQESSVEYRMRDPQDENWIVMNQVIKRINDSFGKEILLGTIQDISIIKSAEQKIFDMAYYDDLTKLANRGNFHQHLKEQLKYAARTELELAVLYLDLDGFKQVNDTFGHEKGDIFLKEFAQRLKKQVRDNDFVARIGGDEFCIVLGDLADGISTMQIAERCLALRSDAIVIDNQSITPQMSIGIAVYPKDGVDVDTLLKAADTAMYSAKQNGKHRLAFYDPKMSKDAAARLQLEADLQQALFNNEFYLLYQPKVSLVSGKITSVEALIRWNHLDRGLVSPDEFIEAAERIGLINAIGEWVLETACRQLQQWKFEGLELEMAVNISPSHFSFPNFIQTVKNVKRQFEIEKGELEIEITESTSRDPQDHIRICRKLKEEGIRIAIDDFGTGYSSLSVLTQLKIDTLKVDRSFIENLPEDTSSAMLLSSIVSIALGLGFDVVAEGVETQEQAVFIHKLGCTYIQGYFFSRPVQADQIPELVRSFASRSKASVLNYAQN